MNRRIASTSMALLTGTWALVVLAACGDAGPTTITDVRELKRPRGEIPSNAPTWHRFGMPPPRGSEPRLAWDLPTGWKHDPTEARPFNFIVVGDEESSAYLTALPKLAGTLADNVNRWRRQMGLEPQEQAAIDALARKPLFGSDAIFVDIEGAYAPMGGGTARSGWRLLGLMFDARDQLIFFKMVGPAATLDAQRDAFLALGASFRRERGESTAPTPPQPAGPRLKWKTPDGWTSKGKSGMREVTFEIEGSESSCWVLFLSAVGGLPDNVNRWLRELGQEPLTEAEIAKLPRLDVLGTQGVLVEGEGDYRGMGGPTTKGALLLGLICPLAGRTLYVKMVGPADAARAQRENFIALCKSLAWSE